MSSPKKIKIVFLIDSFGPGGTQQALFDLAEMMDLSRFEISIIALTSQGDVYSGRFTKPVRVEFLHAGKNSFFTCLDPGVWRGLMELLREISPDVLHARLNGSLLFGALSSMKMKIPAFLFTIEDSVKQEPRWIAGYYRIFLKRARGIFTAYAKEYREMGLPESKLRKYVAGIRKNEIKNVPQKFESEESFPLLLSVGRLHPQKGHQFALRVLEKIKDRFPEAELFICGEGEHREKLETMIREMGLESRAFLKGHIRDIDIFYQRAHIYINLSLNETPNLSNLKALLYGVPTVAFDNGLETYYEIREGVNGFLVKPGDISAAAEKVIRIAGDPVYLESLKESTRKSFPEELLWENSVRYYESIYRSAAELPE